VVASLTAEFRENPRPLWTRDGKHVLATRYSLGHAVAQWTEDGANRATISLAGFSDQYRYLQFIALSPGEKRAAIIVDDFKKMLLADTSGDPWTVTDMVPDDFAYVSGPAWVDDQHLIFTGSRQAQQPKGLWSLDTRARVVTEAFLWLRASAGLLHYRARAAGSTKELLRT